MVSKLEKLEDIRRALISSYKEKLADITSKINDANSEAWYNKLNKQKRCKHKNVDKKVYNKNYRMDYIDTTKTVTEYICSDCGKEVYPKIMGYR